MNIKHTIYFTTSKNHLSKKIVKQENIYLSE